ncbi:three component ABC system middle component [Bradyrhizobium sp. S3.2.12]|uniref:three component ABC system middle component n=1 Tax=Bradyrhizobium sp. S3.2.12 TaxID=3156387 RepID=UPI003390B15B
MEYKHKWDLEWNKRPSEEARNLNPAFCGELIFRAMVDYRRIKPRPFSFALSFVILPIALHKPTRDQLPGKASTAFVGWLADHGPSLAQLPDRVLRLAPVTREALSFLIQNNATKIADGGLVPGTKPIRISETLSQTTDDTSEHAPLRRYSEDRSQIIQPG